jgi:nucleosome binding factor SPN SPT16 subunit
LIAQRTCLLFQEQEVIYNLLLALQIEMLAALKDGTIARDAYHHALKYVREKKPELEKNFVKNIGFGVSNRWFYVARLCLILSTDGSRIP